MMAKDCWSEEDYQYVLNSVKNYLWLYILPSATIKELENAVQNLTSLEEKELDLLSIVHFLLSDEVATFIKAVPRILRRLSHSSQKEVVMNRGFVRGRIDWNLTIKERSSQGYDETIFVCRPPSRIFNLPENQLLKYVLTRIKRLIEETTELPGIEEKNISVEEVEKWTEALSILRFNVNNALKHIHLRQVDLPKQVNERMVRRARTARNKDYEFVVESHSLYRRIVQEFDEKALRELIEKRILEPSEKDTLYEIFVLFKIMSSLGDPEELGLIRSGAESIGTFKVGDEAIHIYFQRIKGLFDESKYKQIFDNYELDVSLRRPDIIIEFEKQGRFLLVEVKRTDDTHYIVDSVYKVLGYLADFSRYFPSKQKPKGVLVVWDIKRVRKTEQDITIIAHNEVADFAREMI